MKRKMKEAAKTEENLTPEEKKWAEIFERQDRAFRRFVVKILSDLFIAAITGIIITILIYVFCALIERAL